jgi:putative transposase
MIWDRGNNGETIFTEERNYEYFLKLFEKHISPIADTFAYCLMPNHFHFLIRIKSDLPGFGNLEGLKPLYGHFFNFFNAYTKAFNKAYNRTGSLREKLQTQTAIRFFKPNCLT